jgi:RNA ligase (TIGR02306 family)
MSERKLASIQTILSLSPIAGADAILLAKVLGWELVVKKTEFQVNDRCVYFEIDSVLPIAQWNDHLRKEGEKDKPVRIKTRRFRGVLSQGLALPLSIFEKHGYKIVEENGDFYLSD